MKILNLIDIAKIVSRSCPYDYHDISKEMELYNSVDLVIDGIDNSLIYNISLQEACKNLAEVYKVN